MKKITVLFFTFFLLFSCSITKNSGVVDYGSPNGEKITYNRLGSCCPFNTKNSSFGGMLDKYEVTYPGLEKSLIIYINMYDSKELMVPMGLKLKKSIS
jgi:hypothetical protein